MVKLVNDYIWKGAFDCQNHHQRRAFEQRFSPMWWKFEQAYFQKYKGPGGVWGGG